VVSNNDKVSNAKNAKFRFFDMSQEGWPAGHPFCVSLVRCGVWCVFSFEA
jgi:hypothetical protein